MDWAVNPTHLNQLMCSGQQIQLVNVHELLQHLLPEQPTGPARTARPRVYIIGIRPDQVAEGAFMGNFHVALDGSDLVEGGNVGGEATVYAEHAVVNQRRDAHHVKQLAECLPRVGVAVLA